MNKSILLRRGLLMVAVPAVLACGRGDKADAKAELPPAVGPGAADRPEFPAIDTKSAAPDTHDATDETTGTTYPHKSAQVAPNVGGVLAKVAVEEGDTVKKGQLLFRLRTGDMSLRVKQAQAALRSAEVALASVKVEYDRMKRLFDKKVIDEASWDRTKAQYDAALAGVDQAKVGVSVAKKGLADATVRSPIAGVVTRKLKNVGEAVSMMPPSPVVIVEDHSILELRFRLPERSLPRIKVGTTVSAAFKAIGESRTAEVVRISPNVDARTRTFEVVANLENKDGSLKSGMLASIEPNGANGEATREDR